MEHRAGREPASDISGGQRSEILLEKSSQTIRIGKILITELRVRIWVAGVGIH
jgi:hypothetical protein